VLPQLYQGTVQLQVWQERGVGDARPRIRASNRQPFDPCRRHSISRSHVKDGEAGCA
jgi:hypothetical protein